MSFFHMRVKKEDGAFAIEAALGLVVFMVAILAIMSMSLMVRVQSRMQYAVNQTAKEISAYYYLLDKAGIVGYMAPNAEPPDTEKINNMIGNVIGLANKGGNVVNDIGSFKIGNPQDWVNMAGNTEAIRKEVDNISFDFISDNPMDQLQSVLSVFAQSLIEGRMSTYVVPLVCQAIMPKYLGGSYDAADSFLINSGIEGGMEKVNFKHSKLIADGRSIKIVAVFTMNTKAMTFGMIDQDMTFHCVGSTAAWVSPENSSILKLSELPTFPDTGS